MSDQQSPSYVRDVLNPPEMDPRASALSTLAQQFRDGVALHAADVDDVARALRALGGKEAGAYAPTLILDGLRGGRLDLHGYSGKVLLRLRGCELTELNLVDAELLGLTLDHCNIGKLDALRLACTGTVRISDGTYDQIALHGASIGGNWYTGSSFPRGEGTRLPVDGIFADGARITGHAIFCGTSCRSLGLSGASVGRDLDLRALAVAGPRGYLSLHATRVGGQLRLGPGKRDGNSQIEVPAELGNMRVEGAVEARGAFFGGGVRMAGLRTSGSVYFDGTSFMGRVDARNMRIEGDLSFDRALVGHVHDGTQADPYKAAGFDLSGSQISGCGFLGSKGAELSARSPLRLRATEIGERLVIAGTLYGGPVDGLSMVGCQVGTELQIDLGNAPFVSCDLRDVTCRRLALKTVPQGAQLIGLRYGMLRVGKALESDAAEAMLRFVNHCHGGKTFSPAPYKALEAYLQGSGSESLAQDVAQERRRRELAAERARAKGPYATLHAWLHSAILWLAGYGYSAKTAVLASLGVVLGFAALGWLAPEQVGGFCAAGVSHCTNSFGTLLGLGVDTFLPVAKIGLWDDLLAVTPAGRFLLAGVRVSGFLLSTLTVGAWSGLMRKG
jgi:uncharacterized protein YjbI with pentapeptide repeats